jgi:hypothetical protein
MRKDAIGLPHSESSSGSSHDMSHDGEDMQSLIFIQEHNVYVLWGQAGTQSINYKARSEKTLSDGTEAPGMQR